MTFERQLAGLSHYPVGLGAMPLSRIGRPDEKQAIATIHAAIRAGISLIDTADVYCTSNQDIGHNERLISKALALIPSKHVRVATKGGLERPAGAWTNNAHPRHLSEACEASLTSLGIESIFLYQLHAPDPKVPFLDSIGALSQLQSEGKVQHIGLSNVSIKQIKEAQSIVNVVSIQNRCNFIDRMGFESGVIEYCAENDMAFLPYCPVGGKRERSIIENHPLLREIANNHAASTYEIALAWLLAKSPCIIPIPGASKAVNAISSCRAARINLSREELIKLDLGQSS